MDGSAQPGDTIEITYEETPLFEKQFVVIHPPEKINSTPRPGDAWIENILNSGLPGFIRLCHYKIVRKAAQGSKDADDFLRKQLNDNLRGLFV